MAFANLKIHLGYCLLIAACYSWTEKLPLSKTALEKTWLYHEIGRCHLEMGNYDDAHDFGEKALAAAHEAKDQVWELNSSVLIAQAEGELFILFRAIELLHIF